MNLSAVNWRINRFISPDGVKMSHPSSASGLPDQQVESPFLEGLRPSEIDQVLAAATVRRFRERTVITRQGAKADHLYMLVEGRARYFIDTNKGQKLLLMWVAPGGLLGGGAATLSVVNYVASTEAVRDSRLLCWDRAAIRELLHRYPRLMDNGLSIAADYMTWSIETLVGLTSHTACERLAHILSGLDPLVGKQVREGFELDVTNEELASAANITPYTTSRLLNRWRKEGLVRKLRGRIILRAPEKLLANIS